MRFNHNRVVHSTVLVVSIALIGCGDDEDSSQDVEQPSQPTLDTNLPTTDGENTSPDSEQPTQPTSDAPTRVPLDELYACEALDADPFTTIPRTCDELACVSYQGLSTIQLTCDLGTLPAEYCSEYEACLATYTTCIIEACPIGTALEDIDQDQAERCGDALSGCSEEIDLD